MFINKFEKHALSLTKLAYGKTFIIGSEKNWDRKGAERLKAKYLPFSLAYLATFTMASGQTVRKNPAE